jgi:hypothetical protein
LVRTAETKRAQLTIRPAQGAERSPQLFAARRIDGEIF